MLYDTRKRPLHQQGAGWCGCGEVKIDVEILTVLLNEIMCYIMTGVRREHEYTTTLATLMLSKLPKCTVNRFCAAKSMNQLSYTITAIEMYIKIPAKTHARK